MNFLDGEECQEPDQQPLGYPKLIQFPKIQTYNIYIMTKIIH